MPKFSDSSKAALVTCHPDLQLLLNQAIKLIDFKVLIGFRNEEDQNEAFYSDNSQLKWPLSKHNQKPSLAVDFVPYPVNWTDTVQFAVIWGVIRAFAWAFDIKLTWGGDWGWDFGHIELDGEEDE